METMEQEKNLQAPSWTPFVERSFWGRVKATFAFVWGNKLTLSCFAVPFVVLFVLLDSLPSVSSFLGNIAKIILFPLVLSICSAVKDNKDLKGVNTGGRYGSVILEQIVYGILTGLTLVLPLVIIFVVYWAICVGGVMDVSTSSLLEPQTWLSFGLLSIPFVVLFALLGIVINLGAVKVSVYERNSEVASAVKYAWKILKGNWWSTIGFYAVCYFALLLVVVFLAVILERVNQILDSSLFLNISVSVIAVFYLAYVYTIDVYQFEHLRCKYEKKQAEEETPVEEYVKTCAEKPVAEEQAH